MFQITFANPDLTTFCRLDELGLRAVGQHLDHGREVLECTTLLVRVRRYFVLSVRAATVLPNPAR